MGLKVIGWQQSEREGNSMGMFTLDRKLWFTQDMKHVVEDGDLKAAYLLGPAGAEIPMREAIRLGLVEKPSEAKPSDPTSKAADKPADKAIRKSENKGR